MEKESWKYSSFESSSISACETYIIPSSSGYVWEQVLIANPSLPGCR